jgi:hypothetical protein
MVKVLSLKDTPSAPTTHGVTRRPERPTDDLRIFHRFHSWFQVLATETHPILVLSDQTFSKLRNLQSKLIRIIDGEQGVLRHRLHMLRRHRKG